MKTVAGLFVLLCVSASASFAASEVAKYEFSSALTSTDTDPTSVAGVFGNVGLGASTFNLTKGNPLPSLQDTGTDIPNSPNDPPTPAPTNASTGYFTFTITPVAGTTLDYSTLSFDIATLTSGTTNNSFTISLQTTLNGFANLNSTTVTGNTTFQTVTWDLSSLTATTAATEFRLVIRDNTTSMVNGIAIDNVIVTADVTTLPIPEPATSMLMGIGLLIGVQRFLRRRKI
jgi:hypothetical protein